MVQGGSYFLVYGEGLLCEDEVVEVVVGGDVVGVARVVEDGFAGGFGVVDEFGVGCWGADSDAVGEVDGGLHEGHVVGNLDFLEGFLVYALDPEFTVHVVPVALPLVVVEAYDDFGFGEVGVFLAHQSGVDGDHCGEPSVEVYEVGDPSEFLSGFECASGEEYGSFVVVGEEFVGVWVGDGAFTAEEVVVVDEVDLHACGLYACDLDEEWVVGVVDNDVEAGETDDFVELVASLVDAAESGHESADFPSAFHDSLA